MASIFSISWREKRYQLILLILAFFSFFIYSYFSFFGPQKFSSPDETANHFFTRQFIETGQFKLAEPLNMTYENILHPRSFGINGEYLIPGSFLGLPLFYGMMGKLFGEGIIYFLGPLIISFSVFFFFLFLQNIFSKRIAFWSSLLLFFQPIFVFYAMRPFWHNGLFVSLVIYAAYFLFKLLKEGRGYQYFLFGFAFCLALAVRTSEIIWLLLTVVAVLGLNYKKVKWRKLFFLLAGVLVIIGPLFYYQGLTFGNSLATAYTRDIFSAASGGREIDIFTRLVGKILPFGFQPMLFFKTFFDYSFKLLFPWFTLAFFALVIIFRKYYYQNENRKIFIYSLWFIGLSIWLMIYYGSFEFYEYLDKSAILFGISYARYWLPLYVFCLPLTVLFLKYISSKIWVNREKFLFGLLFTAIIIISFFQIILDPYYGLKVVKQEFLAQAQDKLNFVLKNTPENAIIIAGANDKLYWPDRRVVGYDGGQVPARVMRNLSNLFKNAQVFYEEVLAGEVDRLNFHLKDDGLVFRSINSSSNIYKLIKIDN